MPLRGRRGKIKERGDGGTECGHGDVMGEKMRGRVV